VLTATLKRARGKAKAGAPSIYIAEKLLGYGLIVAGVFVGLSTLGVNLTSLAVFAGAVGVGVGLGLQGIVREFVSGLVVIFDPVLQLGDFVELEGGVSGEIVEVGPRATRVRTSDGANIVIPNSKLIENRVTNWTFAGGTRRIHVPFTVDTAADRDQVREVVLAAAKALSLTKAETKAHRTQVWMTAFSDQGLKFELVVWPTREAVMSPSSTQAAYVWAIHEALTAAAVPLPTPQMDVTLTATPGRG
jgi:small-conductance mechanosensitive channel